MAYLDPLIITYNCGRELVEPDVFARHITQTLHGIPSPELIVLSLQEISPIAYAFLGGSFLAAYFDRFLKVVHLTSKLWDGGDGRSYTSLITRNLGMTAIMVFVRVDVEEQIRWIEEAGTGVGWQQTGNKGCIGIRLGYASTASEIAELTFLAAHLAPMEDMLEQRNEDWKNISESLVFTSIDGGAGREAEEQPLLSGIGKRPTSGLHTGTTYLIIAGDLNYRTADTKPLKTDKSKFPQANDHLDFSHFAEFLKRDQLLIELDANRTLQGFKEFPITFLPTYKYSDTARADVARTERRKVDEPVPRSPQLDWASHRWPSWCDRILYTDLPPRFKTQNPSLRISMNKYTALPLMSTSDHRPVALSLKIPAKAISLPSGEELASHDSLTPYEPILSWRERRLTARRKEIVIGVLSYLGLTWEGNTILLATLIGGASGWAIVSSMVIE